jgi:uncharacterized protein YecE (DUF72 family)
MAGGQSGRLLVGTSGFAYPDWSPAFYPPGLRPDGFLRHYASQLPACELNNTYYQQPREPKVRAWLEATPEDFRFVVKAQRGGSYRAFGTDPAGSIAWLTPPYRMFGDRLGSVLFRLPKDIKRDDDRLRSLLDAWPKDLPLTVECQDPSWRVDEVLALLRSAGAGWCATETDDDPEAPPIDVTGDWLYLRLRRTSYSTEELEAWAARLSPFLAAGRDAFVFFRHDADGTSALRALQLADLVDARLTAEAAPAFGDGGGRAR